MFERFAEESRAVVVDAHDVALELGSRYLTAGHLLHGCAEVRDETAGRPLRDAGITGAAIRRLLPRSAEPSAGPVDHDLLRAVGVDYDGVRAAVEETFGVGALKSAPDRRAAGGRQRARPRFDPAAKHSLELAVRVARELHESRLLPGHLLLGLLRLDDEFVSAVIEGSQTSIGALSATVLTQLSAAA
ncbi:MAG: Clp protease N-terminal domain-containing protein [Candidatus Nanopelagicales bacterium]